MSACYYPSCDCDSPYLNCDGPSVSHWEIDQRSSYDPNDWVETSFLVYRYDDTLEFGTLYFERMLFVRHLVGEKVSHQMVVDTMINELEHYKPARYRVFQYKDRIDVTVHGKVELHANK